MKFTAVLFSIVVMIAASQHANAYPATPTWTQMLFGNPYNEREYPNDPLWDDLNEGIPEDEHCTENQQDDSDWTAWYKLPITNGGIGSLIPANSDIVSIRVEVCGFSEPNGADTVFDHVQVRLQIPYYYVGEKNITDDPYPTIGYKTQIFGGGNPLDDETWDMWGLTPYPGLIQVEDMVEGTVSVRVCSDNDDGTILPRLDSVRIYVLHRPAP